MADVEVFRFNWWDQESRENVVWPRSATLEVIQRIKGEPIETTRRVVRDDELDGSGFYPKWHS